MKLLGWLLMLAVAVLFSACDDGDEDEKGYGTWSIGTEWWTFNSDKTVTAGNYLGHTGRGNYSINGSTATWRIYWVESPSAVVDCTGIMNGNTMQVRWRNNFGKSGTYTASRNKAAAQPVALEQSVEMLSNSR